MALATQCPYCHTCFRVANDQLKLHAGIVRCGSCQQTFNGIAQLLSPKQTQDLMDGKTPIPKEEKRPIPQETSPPPADLVSTRSANTTDTKTEAASPTPKSEPLLESKANTAASDINTNASTNEEASKSVPPINERNAGNTENTRLENIATERKVEEAIEVKTAISVAKSADTPSIERTPTPANPVQANPAPTSPAPQVWQARPTKNEAPPVDNNIKHVSNVNNLQSTNVTANITAEVKANVIATGSHVDLDFEIDPPASTSPSFSSFDLDFEIDLPTPPKASTKPSSNDFDFEVEEPAKAVIDRAERIEETLPAAIATVTSATHTNQEPNFSTDEFLALKEASTQRIAGKNPEPILNSEPVSIPDELDKLDATLHSTLGATLGATLGSKSEENSDAQLDALNDSTADDKPNFILHAERLEKRKRWRLLSYLLCLILCLTALAQATYFFRNDIVAHYPSSKPHLQKACVLLHCSIQMPAQKEAFIFLADELITLSVEKKLFQLAVQLQNNSSTVQQWPHLLLTLNDQQGKPLLKRTFTPKEYLSDAKELQQGFAARTDIAIKLHFELKTINASNYRVEVIYP